MAKFEIEIITRRGNRFRGGGKTLQETRVMACRWAKDENATVMIRQDVGYGVWKEIEKIWYDPEMTSNVWAHTAFRTGFWIQIYARDGKNGRRCRVSPKTGRLLDASKEWKYL